MLVNASEAAGVGGLYKNCLVESLMIFRAEKSCLIALLEAFREDSVYREEPLDAAELITRVSAKLQGTEFGERALSVTE